MVRAGLTGGIGCGKSTVAAMMSEMGCDVLDADIVAREVVEPGQPAYDEIIAAFGREILSPDGSLDRPKLAKIVFPDASKLTKLNHIVHPRVIARQEAWLNDLAAKNARAIAVIEAALLIEAGAHATLDRLIVVWCNPEQQIERLIAESGRAMSREDALKRIHAQMPLSQKRRMATDEIDNSGGLAATRGQVHALVERLRKLAAKN